MRKSLFFLTVASLRRSGRCRGFGACFCWPKAIAASFCWPVTCPGEWGSGQHSKPGEIQWSGGRVVAYTYSGGSVRFASAQGLAFTTPNGSKITLNEVPVAGSRLPHVQRRCRRRWHGSFFLSVRSPTKHQIVPLRACERDVFYIKNACGNLLLRILLIPYR